MEISQIQVMYLDQEDRMLMRMNLGADKHLSLVLTRRVCRFVLEHLSLFLKIDGPIGRIPAPESANDHVVNPSNQSSVSIGESPEIQADEGKILVTPPPPPKLITVPKQTMPFQERSQEGNLLGVDAEPVLVNEASCVHSSDTITLTFLINGRESFNVTLARDLGFGLHSLLNAVAGHAQWFITITISANPVDVPSDTDFPAAHEPSSTYH